MSNIVEKFKKDIESIVNKNIKDKRNLVSKLLDISVQKNEITEQEKIELMLFLKKKMEEKQLEQDQLDREERMQKLKEEMEQVYKSFNVEAQPIYKGKIGVTTTKNSVTNHNRKAKNEFTKSLQATIMYKGQIYKTAPKTNITDNKRTKSTDEDELEEEK